MQIARTIQTIFRLTVLLLLLLMIPGIYFSVGFPSVAPWITGGCIVLLAAVVIGLHFCLLRPYKNLLKGIATEDHEIIGKIAGQPHEFGEIASLILRFFNQKKEFSAIIREKNELLSALTVAHNKNRAIFASIPDSLFRINLFGVISDFHISNSDDIPVPAARMTGLNIEELLPAEAVNGFRQSINALRKNTPPVTFDFGWNTASNKRKYFEAHLSLSGQGDYILILRNITIRKQFETAMQDMLEKELALSNLKSKFIGNISHAFRTPLTAIQSNRQLLEHFGTRITPEQQNTALERIGSSVAQMTRVLDDLKKFSGDRNERHHIQFSTIDLLAVCRSLTTGFHKEKDYRGRIKLVLPEEPCPMKTDMALLHKALLAILDNALKFSDSRSMVLFSLEPPKDNLIAFSIKDTGIGIPEEEIATLFDPFFRGSNAAEYPGSGLGLTIARRCIDLLGGDIEIKSKPGHGTEVSVLFRPEIKEENGS